MPVYNEQRTVEMAAKRLLDVAFPCDVELVIVDDGSRDATPDKVASLDDPRVISVRHPGQPRQGRPILLPAGALLMPPTSGELC